LTRDSLLPEFEAAHLVRTTGQPFQDIVAGLSATDSGKIEFAEMSQTAGLMSRLSSGDTETNIEAANRIFADTIGENIVDMVFRNGVAKFTTESGYTLGFRPSGNEPAFRIYIGGKDASRRAELVTQADASLREEAKSL